MSYMEKVYNLNELFADTKLSSKGEPFIIRYTPIGWCPSKVSLSAERTMSALGEDAIAKDPTLAIMAMLPVLADVVIDWNLEYDTWEGDDDLESEDTLVVKKLPLPRKIARLKDAEERQSWITMLPVEVLTHFFFASMRIESEIPLAKLSESVNGSDELKVPPQESPVNDQIRLLTPVPDAAQVAEQQLQQLERELKLANTQASPTG